MSGPRDPDGRHLDPAVLAVVEGFQEAMRRGDLDRARSMAPNVVIETEGWPYEDETGPLNPDAFSGDPAAHRVMGWELRDADHWAVGTGIASYEVRRIGEDLVITDGYLKPVE